ncbi:MAG: glycosyltransferase family 9 protein [Deltaproteobacteria bacterium]|nr:glycosyltransferase family 9 protein [Deltaproteobacteria bacterium]
MKVITPRQDLSVTEVAKSNKVLKTGVEYVVADFFPERVAAQFGPGIIEAREYAPPNFYGGESLKGKSLFCFRTGGIGDLLFIATSMRQVKKNFPSAELTLGCDSTFIPILDGERDGFDLVSMPLEKKKLDEYDYILFFQGIIEGNPDAEETNAYDLLKEAFHLDGLDNPLPNVRVEERIRNRARNFLHKTSAGIKYKMGVQVAASVQKRSVPPQVFIDFIKQLPQDYMVYFVGGKNQYELIDLIISHLPEHKRSHVVNASKDLPSLPEAVALMGELDLVIGPDSSMLHIAAAHRVPLIGLYGPFPSDLRLRYYQNAIGIDSMTLCEFARGRYQSCFEHGDGVCALAAKTGDSYSPCMSFFLPKHIFQAMEALGFPVYLSADGTGGRVASGSGV